METEQTKPQHMTLIVLSGALLAAIAVALVIYFLPSLNSDTTELPVENGQVALDNSAVTSEFNTSVLQRKEYTDLDMSLFSRGLLPVQPPTGVGKTNLFR
jgi:hypothetical protein